MTLHLSGSMTRAAIAAIGVALVSVEAAADEGGFQFVAPEDSVYLYGGTYFHFTPSDDHAGTRWTVGAEVRKKSDWIYGLNLFNNSYDQFSQYGYFGKRFPLPWLKLHAKFTGGIIHGYHGDFNDKLPINTSKNIAPAVIASLGRDFGKWEVSVNTLGLSGLMFALGYDIWQ